MAASLSALQQGRGKPTDQVEHVLSQNPLSLGRRAVVVIFGGCIALEAAYERNKA
ncbi:hypothetical protein [Mesorhizobium sp. M2E.F.Ca.ET.219.01.1.1]|uniref:hypothetical protein n=1 Tax=Mesorhizobium sp. M2E.F.Ca.ET.219.01.1.1 TaxID=2500530 RepID=UPI00187D487C|nr:hypothetical protein [Mesorhizobium sp. M2E.F.Ca.ET.219.01.1.1]